MFITVVWPPMPVRKGFKSWRGVRGELGGGGVLALGWVAVATGSLALMHTPQGLVHRVPTLTFAIFNSFRLQSHLYFYFPAAHSRIFKPSVKIPRAVMK